jgi:hypothetical protein
MSIKAIKSLAPLSKASSASKTNSNWDDEYEEYLRFCEEQDSQENIRLSDDVLFRDTEYEAFLEQEYSDDYTDEYQQYNTSNEINNSKPKSKKNTFVPVPITNPMAWSPENTSKIAKGIRELEDTPEESDDEDDIILDDVDFINNIPNKHKRIPVIKHEVRQETIDQEPHESRENTINPIIATKERLQKVYEKDCIPIEQFILTQVSPAPQNVESPFVTSPNKPDKPDKVKIDKKNMFSELQTYETEHDSDCIKKSENVILKSFSKNEELYQLNKQAIMRYSQNPEESEPESEEEEPQQPSRASIEPEESEEKKAWRDAIVARLMAKHDEQRRKMLEQKARAATLLKKSQNTKKSDEATARQQKKQIKRERSNELMKTIFQQSRPTVTIDQPRIILKKIMVPKITSALYCKLLMQMPDEMIKLRDQPEHMIYLPPLATSDMLIASPTSANVMHTPIVPAPLCRNGIDCSWFKQQAYEALNLEVPLRYQTAPTCHYMHVGSELLQIDGARVVQCSVMGCDSEEHYMPNDDNDIAIIHMTKNEEQCGHDHRNFCLNTLSEGCCRQHNYTGPLMVSMIMRGALAAREDDAYKWPLTNNSYLFKISREIMEARIPIKGQTDTLEKRLIGRGNWPPQSARVNQAPKNYIKKDFKNRK